MPSASSNRLAPRGETTSTNCDYCFFCYEGRIRIFSCTRILFLSCYYHIGISNSQMTKFFLKSSILYSFRFLLSNLLTCKSLCCLLLLFVVVVIIGSGKRRRTAHNPDKWASSILSQRTKVLALGVSYPSVKDQIHTEISPEVNKIWTSLSFCETKCYNIQLYSYTVVLHKKYRFNGLYLNQQFFCFFLILFFCMHKTIFPKGKPISCRLERWTGSRTSTTQCINSNGWPRFG